MIFLGIDIGSLSTKSVLIDENGKILDYDLILTGANSRRAGRTCYDNLLSKKGIKPEDLSYVVATGYGRISAPFADKQVTEITCHAAGMSHLLKDVKTILDVGGQDSKSIRINGEGKVLDFAMNDKCAAGTGRFLEVMARTLEVDLEDMGELSLKAKGEVKVSSMCTVFAESEVVSLIAEGHPKEEILRGLHRAIADRTASLVDRVGMAEKVAMSGGVAKNQGVRSCLEERLGVKIYVVEEPQIVGAVGAALIASRMWKKKQDDS